jgi:hypothetical protein
MVGFAFAVAVSALEITMPNIEQQTEPAMAPQRKPNLDMASHIAVTPVTQVRDGDEEGPAIKMPLGAWGW